MEHLSIWLLILIFAASATAIWVAGIYLSQTTDALSNILHLGQALGGMIILAVVTNLPEIAITISASLQGKTELAVGNLLGGIAIQTLVLVALDAFGVGKKGSLIQQTTSLEPALEAILVVTVLSVVVVGRQLPSSLIFLRITPAALSILIVWIAGLYLLSKAKKDLPWQPKDKTGTDQNDKQDKQQNDGKLGKGKTVLIFSISALVTLVAGVALEESGDALSKQIGMQGVLFGV